MFGRRLALIGAGMIGRLVIEFLRPFELRVIVYDPYLTEAEAAGLGVVKVTLDEAFERAYVVTNHAPNVPETTKMLTGDPFRGMRADATFINTGRGATIDEPAMVEVLAARPDITALLDVTYPEPPAEGSPLYTLPNVHLTSHIAGSMNDELVRMADYTIAEFLAWESGRPPRYAITLERLKFLA